MLLIFTFQLIADGEEPIEGPPAEEENKEEGEDKAEDAPPSEETPDAEAPAAEE